jgi:hypothetical protein
MCPWISRHGAGARLVGANNLFDRGSYGSTARIGNCVYSSMRDPSDLPAPTTGTAVIDNSVPSNPQIIGMLRTPTMIKPTRRNASRVASWVRSRISANGTNPVDIYDVSVTARSSCRASASPAATMTAGSRPMPRPTTNSFGGVRLCPVRPPHPFSILPHRFARDRFSDPVNPKPLLTWNRLQMPPEVQALSTSARNHELPRHQHQQGGNPSLHGAYGGNNSLGGNNNNPIPSRTSAARTA